jgi:hypothetical protein
MNISVADAVRIHQGYELNVVVSTRGGRPHFDPQDVHLQNQRFVNHASDCSQFLLFGQFTDTHSLPRQIIGSSKRDFAVYCFTLTLYRRSQKPHLLQKQIRIRPVSDEGRKTDVVA